MNELYKTKGICNRCHKELKEHQKVFPKLDNKQYFYCEKCEAITLGNGHRKAGRGNSW